MNEITKIHRSIWTYNSFKIHQLLFEIVVDGDAPSLVHSLLISNIPLMKFYSNLYGSFGNISRAHLQWTRDNWLHDVEWNVPSAKSRTGKLLVNVISETTRRFVIFFPQWGRIIAWQPPKFRSRLKKNSLKLLNEASKRLPRVTRASMHYCTTITQPLVKGCQKITMLT